MCVRVCVCVPVVFVSAFVLFFRTNDFLCAIDAMNKKIYKN